MNNCDFTFYNPEDPSASPEFIVWAYRILLQRNPSKSEIQFIAEGECFKEDLLASIASSQELSENFDIQRIVATETFQDKKQLIFLHIPKCFGSSLVLLLKKIYFSHCTRISNFTTGDKIFTKLRDATVVSGHIDYTYLKKTIATSLFLSSVREPIARCVSLFQYYRTVRDFEQAEHSQARRYPWYFNEKSLMDTLRKSRCAEQFLDNVQCYALSGHNTFEAVLEVWEKENFIVGCFDNPQEFVNSCARLLHWQYWVLPRENVARDPTYKERILSAEPGLENFLIERNQEDIKLYEYVKSKIVVNTVKPDFDLTPLYPDYKRE